MKISIDIDCTAQEARDVMGLPDVKPLQEIWLAQIEKKMIADMERYSPDALIKSWASGSSSGADWMQSLFESISGHSTAGTDDKNSKNGEKSKKG